MYLVPILIAIEIIVGVITAMPPSRSGQVLLPNKTNRNILGESDEQTPTPTPEENTQPTPTPEESTQPTATPAETQPTETPAEAQPTVAPTEAQQNSEVQPSPDQPTPDQANPQPTSEESQLQVTPEITVQVTPTENPNLETHGKTESQNNFDAALQKQDALFFPELSGVSTANTLSNQTVTNANNENKQLESTTTPQEKANMLVKFETNNLQTLHTNLKNSDFDDLAFNAGRLSHQIDKTIDTIQSLPPAESQAYRTKIDTICKNTDYLLRPSELALPESFEQAVQITRGKCFNFEK